MAKYKVMINNPFEIGKFKSKDGILNAVKPNAREQKKIDNAISNGILKEVVARKPAATTTEP